MLFFTDIIREKKSISHAVLQKFKFDATDKRSGNKPSQWNRIHIFNIKNVKIKCINSF